MIRNLRLALILLSFEVITQCDNVKTYSHLPINKPLYFYSEETQSYTELIFTQDEIFVFNKIGGINLGLYNQNKDYIIRVHMSDTIAYFFEKSWVFCLEEKHYRLRPVDSLLVSNNFQSGFAMRQAIFEMQENSEKKDSVIHLNLRNLK